jgi:hypothetical protein
MSIGERFARSLLAKDWAGVEDVIDPAVDFRGLTPGSPWEATESKTFVKEIFQHWFEPTDEIYEIVDVSTDRVVDRQRVVYRFRIRNPDGDYVCEQTAYFDEVDNTPDGGLCHSRGVVRRPMRHAQVHWLLLVIAREAAMVTSNALRIMSRARAKGRSLVPAGRREGRDCALGLGAGV